MPIKQSSKKSLRSSLRKRVLNKKSSSDYKKSLKEFNAKKDEKTLAGVFSKLDKLVKKHIFHKNKVARLKSELAKKLNLLKKPESETAPETKKPVKKATKKTVIKVAKTSKSKKMS